MEGHSDKSSSLSVDSGGLIDLSVLDSDCKTGDSSLDKSKEGGADKKRQRQSSGEAWLLDMDTKMKDMKLIEEEEFDFDIPDDYLNISMEPEQPSSVEDSLSSDGSSPEPKGLLVEVGGEEGGSQVARDPDKRICNRAEKEHTGFGNLTPLCAVPGGNPCNHDAGSGLTDPGISQVSTVEETGQNSSVGVVELLPMGCCDTTRVISASKHDLIAFTPAPQEWANLREDGASVTHEICGEIESARVNCRTTSPVAYICQEQLGQPEVSGQTVEEQLGQPEVSGQTVEEQLGRSEVSGQTVEEQLGQPEVSGQTVEEQLGQPEVSGQMVEEQLGQSEISGQTVEEQASRSHEGECGGNTSAGELQKRSSDSAVHLNRSRLPTPSEQLKNCSTFSRSPVKCSQLEELREATKHLKNHSLPHHCSSETPLQHNTNETVSTASLLPNLTGIQQSSSHETFIIPSNSSDGSSLTTENPTENLDDSRSSCLSQVSQASSTSSTASRSRDSYGGGGSKLPRKSGGGGGRGIPAPSKNKLVKPGTSKPSLLPSTSIPMGTKLKRPSEKLPTKLTMLPRDSQSSQSSLRLKLPSAGSGTAGTNAANTTRLIPRPSATNDKGSRKFNPIRATHLTKPSMLPAKSLPHHGNNVPNSKGTQQRQSAAAVERVPKSKLASPGPRKKSTCTVAAAKPKSSSTSTALALSTSLVSTGSPSVQQSTPLKQGEKVVDGTPKRRSTVDQVRPMFSLSSIEGSVTPKPPPSALCPRSDETYVVGGGGGDEEGNVAKTPKSTKKGRRSLIPTPKGQERVCGQGDASPILLNSNSLGEGEDHSRRSTNMPPPKTKKLLNPRARPSGLQRPLQRGGGTRVLGVRPNGCKKTEGPMKARRTFTFGGHDEETEVPLPRARVVHSPIDKENLPATPHSKWSPIRKKKYLTAEEECIQCTKRSVK